MHSRGKQRLVPQIRDASICVCCQLAPPNHAPAMHPMSTLSVPNSVKPRFDAVVGITDAVCRTHLTEEYATLARELAAALARKRPSPLMRGRADTWACGVTYPIGAVNFLFDPAQTPHPNSRE